MKIFPFFIYFLLMSFSAFGASDTLYDYCARQYEQKKVCPGEICLERCADPSLKGEECSKVCLAKECFQITAKNCPEKYCQVLDGCNGQKVCYPFVADQGMSCGDLAYEGQRLECCKGFVKRCGVEFFDGSCDMKGEMSIDAVPICLPCGNGICNQFENRCNCPEDCGNFKRKDVPRREQKSLP